MTIAQRLDLTSEGSIPLVDDVDTLACALAEASPTQIIEAAVRAVAPGKLALVSSFGTESALLIAYMAQVDRSIPVVFLDTGWLFEETLAYRDTLTEKLGLTDVRTILPDAARVAELDPNGDLWDADTNACCRIRKVEPLARALSRFDGWLNGRKRYQGGLRATIPVVERDGARLKFNPLATLEKAEVEAAAARFDLPAHPLLAKGFGSVGCMPCTGRSAPGEDARSGRWRGRDKVECGIHTLLSTV